MEGESMSEWKEVKLGDVCNLYSGGTPNKNNKTYWNGNIPWISAKSMYGDYIEDADLYITEKGLSNGSRLAPKGSILILTRGSGLYNRIPICYTLKDVAFNQDVKRIESKDEDLYPNDLLYYILYANKKTISSIIESTGIGAGKIDTDRFLNLPITIPPVYIQKDLMELFNAIFSKIETNNKLNEKLEEMAQAIFKSWFVDFEPFKDMPFHETEIGYIPQIFASGVLGDLCTFKRGKVLLSKDAIHGEVPVIAGGMKPACYHNIANTKAPVVTVSGSGANAGYTQIHNVDVWASDCSFIDSNCENLYYAYCFLSRRPKLLKHSQTGAAQPHVKPADIHRFQVVIPTNDVINEFQQIVKPLFDIIGMNKKENDRLASLRDTLLPRLMSGELIV